MATFQEYWQGVTGGQDTRSIRYLVEGATDDNDALDTIELGSPVEYDNMVRDEVTVVEIDKVRGMYECTAVYRRGPRRSVEKKGSTPTVDGTSPNAGLFAFQASLGTRRLYEPFQDYVPYDAGPPEVPREAQKYFPTGSLDAKPHEGLGYENGVYQGVDVLWPERSFSLDRFPDNAKVTAAYQESILLRVGAINSDPFNGYEAGEVLCTQIRGETRTKGSGANDGDWRISWDFEVRFNQPSTTIAGITVSNMQGWDGHWIEWYEQAVDIGTGKKETMQVPRQVNLFKQYPSLTFQDMFT